VARPPIPTYYAVVVVVCQDDRFLLIREIRFGQTWYLPAGRVEPGEELAAAARRETLEETGLEVALDGIIRVEHDAAPAYSRVRVLFVAHPTGAGRLKTEPDEHSLEARWVTLEEARRVPLRWQEALAFMEYAQSGQPVYPLSLLARLTVEA